MMKRCLAVFLALWLPVAQGQENRAYGFAKMASGARIALVPMDIELFEVSAGGVLEPRADWTRTARQHVKDLLRERKVKLGTQVVELEDDGSEQVAELLRLHGAVGQAILLHHFGQLTLETKDKKLDWTLGTEAGALRQKSGADYALFTFLRDSYASSDRVATLLIGFIFARQIIPPRVGQQGYASLVDLRTGQVVWFNRILRITGDLRERERASETLDALLSGFPQ